jgi:DNA-directed RNA polymerase specialized sigma24 family protein
MTKNREDTEDVLQETLMKAFIHLGGFEGRSAFSSWLTRIAINGVLMMRRKRSSHPESSIEGVGDQTKFRSGTRLQILSSRCLEKRESIEFAGRFRSCPLSCEHHCNIISPKSYH